MPYTYSQQMPNPAVHHMAMNHMQVSPQVSYTAHHTHVPPPQSHVMMIQTAPQQPHQQMQPGHHQLPHGPPQMTGPMQGEFKFMSEFPEIPFTKISRVELIFPFEMFQSREFLKLQT